MYPLSVPVVLVLNILKFVLGNILYTFISVVLYKPNTTLSDHLLHAVLHLLDKEVSEHGRNLTHYFSLFQTYASLGPQERTQLLNVSFSELMMLTILQSVSSYNHANAAFKNLSWP